MMMWHSITLNIVWSSGTEAALETLKQKHPAIDFSTQQRPTGGKGASALKREFDAISKKLEDMQQRLDHDAAAALPQTKREFAASTDKVVLLGKNKKNLVKAIETLDLSKVIYYQNSTIAISCWRNLLNT